VAKDRLFDASALVDLVLGITPNGVTIEVVYGHRILDLTMYEASNALWKTGVANDALTDDELKEAVEILGRLNREVTFERVTETGLPSTMRTARETGATFYDASYLTVAERNDLALITEDRPQRQAATQQGVTVHSLADLAGDGG
jgi:predicted nucleic acid-binding protein